MASRFVYVGISILLWCHSASHAVALEEVESLEDDEGVSLTFSIPVVPANVPIIVIKHSVEDAIVAFVRPRDMSVDIFADYKNQITKQSDLSKRQVTLTFKTINAADAGLYECFQRSTSTKFEGCGIKLILIRTPDPPSINITSQSGKVIGEDLILQCKTSSRSLPSDHGRDVHVEWWIDPLLQGDVSDKVTTDRDELVLSNIERDDKGLKFKCKSADVLKDPSRQMLMSDYSPEYEVLPEYSPSPEDIIMVPPTDYGGTFSVMLASPLNFTCTVTCEPECDVYWEFKDFSSDSFSSVPNAYSSGGRLGINSVLRVSHGEYQCVGKNVHGSIDHRFYLNVLYMLTPIAYINGIETDRAAVFEEDGDVVLRCDFDCNPRPTVSWLSPDNQLLPSSALQGPEDLLSENNLLVHRYTSETTLTGLTCRDSGVFICKSQTDNIGPMSKEITVDVKCKPRPILEGPNKMKPEYVWQIPYDLSVQFLVEAWPRPKVKNVKSEKDGKLRKEQVPTDVEVNLQEPYDRKRYLTLVQITSRRILTEEDAGRVFFITLENSDYEVPFQFTIHPRGPPHPVTNITVDHVFHNEVLMSWLPNFNGGETQTFFVHILKSARVQSGRAVSENKEWISVIDNLPDSAASPGGRVEAKVVGLIPSTEYTLRIMSLNSIGNSTVEIAVKTRAAPASSMSGGAVVGIVFAIIIVIIIAVVLFYVFVYRKRWGKGSALKPAIPSRVRAVFGRFRGHQNGGTDATKIAPKERRPIFLGNNKPTPKTKDYQNVPTESADPTLLDDDYANANDIRSPMLKEPIYSNTDPSVPGSQENGDGDRNMNEDGLVYTSLDFSKAPAPKKRHKKKKQKEKDDNVTYSDIDFARTKAKELEIEQEEEEERRREEEARRKKQLSEEEENPYQAMNPGPGTAV